MEEIKTMIFWKRYFMQEFDMQYVASDLLDMIDEEKLYEYIISMFNQNFTYEELYHLFETELNEEQLQYLLEQMGHDFRKVEKDEY